MSEMPATERLLVVANQFNADLSEGAPIWTWPPEAAEELVMRLIDATEAAWLEYNVLTEVPAATAEDGGGE